MDMTMQELRAALNLSPNYPEENHFLEDNLTDEIDNEEIRQHLGIDSDWMEAVDTSQIL
ncbi:hypothetical protein [Escherichia coli]|uniref:Uncharacterized protein n=2 Tax=root TaxID=1 RepID=W1X445_ECOLX|nr:hypothetical protein [Escherichia coli]ETJ24165.1 MAG: hypothetical protein Q609_ECAC01443G0007 [Escherichia coli DORA_A_5_14_21]USJ83307.1 hypothetical protein LXH19_06290 [Shigella sp. PIB]EHY7336206.1 hypothetical protein [Escherichia coli]EJL9392447.1 hypothetical protein [Escherichia coli]EKU6438327.1 hypothetical protein [Escherichia coli]